MLQVLLLLLALEPAEAKKALPLEKVNMPEGFKIELFAEVPNARAMVWGDDGVLYVGSRRAGQVHAVVDSDGDWRADAVHEIDSGLALPTGVAFRDGSLYVAAVFQILRYDNIGQNLTNPPEPVVVLDDLPQERHHGWKYIDFGPDGYLYVPVGAPCNICKMQNPIFASIMRMKPDGTEREVYAHGVRNTVGFDWHPETGELWFSDNGRDWMGDDLPPCELNRAYKPGLHFGYPYFHGNSVPDPEFGDSIKLKNHETPVQDLGPHVAPLGIRFYTGDMFPPEYKNKVFIAEHGSWNRTEPIGYRITTVSLDGNKSTGYDVFADGWLEPDGNRWGRPVSLVQAPDGSMLISDDYGNAIYRISYQK